MTIDKNTGDNEANNSSKNLSSEGELSSKKSILEYISHQDVMDEAEYDKSNDNKDISGDTLNTSLDEDSASMAEVKSYEHMAPIRLEKQVSQLTGSEASFVVCVGASAGGLEALQSLFEVMPLNTGMAFVVVQHLSPDYKSLMDELLARKTTLPIHVAVDQIPLFANHIYLLPPKKEMIVANTQLLLTDRANSDTLNLPINTFLGSLAESYQDRAIAIILSGTGSDGSEGIGVIHDNGGMVLAQNPEESQFDGMPKSAIASGNVDLVVKVTDMPEALMNYSRRTDTVRAQYKNETIDGEEKRFSKILILLNTRFDIDFRHYKPSTITRRIERRLNMKGCNLKDYTRLLMSNEHELDALYRDLLIGVTKFFRDPAAFHSLGSEISLLIKYLKGNEELRLWSVACASGQEPYSLAMLIHDICLKENHSIEFKIFATDMHPGSIEFASRGVYQERDMEGLSADFRRRYFVQVSPGTWQIISEIRQHIVFAQHNILKDPPFTKMALVTCRNLLIYFDIAAQQRVISLLAFSLRNHGRLFLGPSETLGRHERDFKIADLANKIYEKKGGINARPNLQSISDDKYNIPVFRSNRISTSSISESARASIKNLPARSGPSIREQKALEALLQIYVPPSLLIDGNGDVLHVFGEAGNLLSLSVGSPSLNLRHLVGEPAKTVLGQMLHRVKKNHTPVKVVDVKGFINQKLTCIEMRILPGFSTDSQNFLVTLSDSTAIKSQIIDRSSVKHIGENHEGEVFEFQPLEISDIDVGRIRDLEVELQETKESLQSVVEELEASNEELQATNEELMASNEELQSTNEELQSVNEELLTVNSEFKTKEVQAAEAEADERSVIEKSGIGILFLDNQLRVRKFSPVAQELFKLDHKHLNISFASLPSARVKTVLTSVNQVLNDGGFIEHEIIDQDGTVYHMLINSLEALDKRKKSRGVIITLTNISSLYATRERLVRSESSLQSILDNLTDGYVEWHVNSDSLYLSEATIKTLGYSSDTSLSWFDLLVEDAETVLKELRDSLKAKRPFQSVLPLRTTHNGQVHWMLCKGHFINKSNDNDNEDARFYGHFIDMHDYKLLEQRLQEQMKELERSNGMLEEFAHIVSHDLKAPLRHSNYSLQFLKEALAKQDMEQVDTEMNSLFNHMKTLKNLIDDVIQFSRVSAEKKHAIPVSLDDVIESALDLNIDIINEKSVAINCMTMPIVYGDKSMLVHLFQNLIGNACKYNEHKIPTIDISSKNVGNMCFVRVKDNGIGMVANAAEKIFKPFHRLVTKQEYEGSGIGLAICKMLAEQHGGHIGVETELGEGSVFTVSLPQKKK